MTSVVQHFRTSSTGGTAHRVELSSPLPEEDNNRDLSGRRSPAGQSRRTSSLADFGPTKTPTPPPVAKKPDWLKKRSLKPTPPPAPVRSSSISTIQKSMGKDKKTMAELSETILEAEVLSSLDHPNVERKPSTPPRGDIHLDSDSDSNAVPAHADSSALGHFNSNTMPAHSGSNGVAMSNSSKPVPIPAPKSHTLQHQRHRTSVSPTNGQDQTTGASAAISGGVASGRRLHSSFSTSQPQLNKVDQHTLVKPRDRIRSILVGDITSSDDPTSLQDDYGSSYNTSLMKMPHSDLQKHAIAVTMPVVPPTTVAAGTDVAKHRSSSVGGDEETDEKYDGISHNIISVGDGRKLEDSTGSVKLDPRDRAHTSPYHSRRNDVTANRSSVDRGGEGTTEVNPLSMSDPIARAYRQHLMTRMEQQGRKLGEGVATAKTPSSPGNVAMATNTHPHNYHHHHQEVSFTRSWEPGVAGKGVGTNYAVGTAQTLPANVRAKSISNNPYNQRSYSQVNSTVAREASSTDVSQPHSTISEKKGVDSTEGVLRSGSPSIMESVRFFENVQVVAIQDQRGASTGGSSRGHFYGTLPRTHSHHHYGHGSLNGQKETAEWKNKAKSIDNLSISHEDDVVDGESFSSRNGFTLQQGVAHSGHSVSSGEVWPPADITNVVKQAPSSCSPSDGSSATPSPRPHHTPLVQAAEGYASCSGSSPGIHFGLSHQTNTASISNVVLKPLVPLGKPLKPSLRPNVGGHVAANHKEEQKLGPNEFLFFDYVAMHSSQFPRRVRITRALSNDVNKLSLSAGDSLDLHFTRKMKAVEFVDANKTTFAMPINSSMKISVFYDPFGSDKMAALGFTFKTAGCIMDLRNPPPVVAVRQSILGVTPETSLEQGEILMIQDVRNTYHGRLLRAFSLTANTEKLLDESCSGDFTTEPALIKMALSDILEHSVLLPQRAFLHFQDFAGTENAKPGSAASCSLLVTLKKFVVRSYVMATPVTKARSGSEKASLLEIDSTVDVVVEELPALEEQRNTFLQIAQNLINSSAHDHALPYLGCPDSVSHSLQLSLLANLNLSSQSAYEIAAPRGITIPPTKHVHNSTHKKALPLPSKASSRVTMNEQKLAAMEQKYANLEEKVSGMCSRLEDVCQKVEKIHNYLNKAQTAMNEHKRRLGKPAEDIGRSSSSTGKGQHGSHSSQRESVSVSSPIPTQTGSELQPPTGSFPKSSFSSFSTTTTTTTEKSATTLQKFSSSNSLEDNSDDVFVAKDSKPPVLHPKPTVVPARCVAKEITTKQEQQGDDGGNVPVAKLPPTKQATRGPTEKAETGKSSSISSSSKLSTSSSTRQSVDLSDFLLPDCSSTDSKSTPTSDNDPQKLPQLNVGDNSIDSELDISNWCSKIEDELTKLYNESIMAIP